MSIVLRRFSGRYYLETCKGIKFQPSPPVNPSIVRPEPVEGCTGSPIKRGAGVPVISWGPDILEVDPASVDLRIDKDESWNCNINDLNSNENIARAQFYGGRTLHIIEGVYIVTIRKHIWSRICY